MSTTTFQSLIAGLPQRIQEVVILKTKYCEEQGNLLGRILRQVNCYEHPLLQDSQLPYFALTAYRIQAISIEQFMTIQAFWAAKSDLLERMGASNIEVIPFTDSRAISIVYRALEITQGNSVTCKLSEEITLFTPKQIEKALEDIKKAPHSEQVLFVWNENDCKSTSEVLSEIGFPISRPEPGKRMILPQVFFQLLMRAKFENEIQIAPIIGLVTLEEMIEGQRKKKRYAQVPFPGFISTEADGHPTKGSEFFDHDRYHWYVASCAGSSLLNQCMEMGDVCRNLEKSSRGMLGRVVKELSEQFYDAEIPTFRLEMRPREYLWNRNESSQALFWHGFSDLIMHFSAQDSEELHEVTRNLLLYILIVQKSSLSGLNEACIRLVQLNKYVEDETHCAKDADPFFQRELGLFVRGIHPLQLLLKACILVGKTPA